jgi:hypothetical protein
MKAMMPGKPATKGKRGDNWLNATPAKQTRFGNNPANGSKSTVDKGTKSPIK